MLPAIASGGTQTGRSVAAPRRRPLRAGLRGVPVGARRVVVAGDRVPGGHASCPVSELDPVLGDEVDFAQSGDGAVHHVHGRLFAVHGDAALLVFGDGAAAHGAADCACRFVAVVVNGQSVLGAVGGRLADFGNRAVGDVDRDIAVLAVDEDAIVGRAGYVSFADVPGWGRRAVVDANLATGRIEFASDVAADLCGCQRTLARGDFCAFRCGCRYGPNKSRGSEGHAHDGLLHEALLRFGAPRRNNPAHHPYLAEPCESFRERDFALRHTAKPEKYLDQKSARAPPHPLGDQADCGTLLRKLSTVRRSPSSSGIWASKPIRSLARDTSSPDSAFSPQRV